jgi:hypothetical protein
VDLDIGANTTGDEFFSILAFFPLQIQPRGDFSLCVDGDDPDIAALVARQVASELHQQAEIVDIAHGDHRPVGGLFLGLIGQLW